MESLGLAANILQFVDFTAKLVRISNELRHAASTSENQGYAAITEHLRVIAEFDASAQAIQSASATVPPENEVSLSAAPSHTSISIIHSIGDYQSPFPFKMTDHFIFIHVGSSFGGSRVH